jgi:hypothetical protein
MEELSGQTSEALLARPRVTLSQSYYLDAFQTLSEWRQYSTMGDLMPLTLADIVNYFSIYKIDSVELRDTLVRHVKMLDRVYLNNKAAASKVEEKPKVADADVEGYTVQ